jgi:hypothetical protein
LRRADSFDKSEAERYDGGMQSLFRRWWSFLRGRRAPAAGAERRTSPRIAVAFAAAFSADHAHGQGVLADLSLGGCLIETANPPPADTLLAVKLFAPDEKAPLEATASVHWVDGNRMGVKFLRVQSQDRLLKLLSQV